MQNKAHWENVYSVRAADDVSWYQEHAEESLRLIHNAGAARSSSIIDVGGGASTLVDDLLKEGYSDLTVLDLSSAALSAAKKRIGDAASKVKWIEANILEAALPRHAFDIWHDRAVFHFLISEEERHAYVETVLKAVKPGGRVIIATFAEDGPEQCSGLPVRRYNANGLHDEFGSPFELLGHEEEAHQTPSGKIQKFIYCYCRKTQS